MRYTKILFLTSILLLLKFIEIYSQSDALYWFNQAVNVSSVKKKIEFYNKALDISPNFIEAHINLGRAYKNTGQLAEAETSYNNALTCNPGQLQHKMKQTILYELGLIYEKLGRYEEAEVSLIDALKITNENSLKAMMLYHLGIVNLYMEQYDRAISFYEQGIDTYPVNSTSFKTAIEQAKQQQKINNYYLEGMNLIAQSQYEDAIVAFENILKIDPEYKDIKQLVEETKSKLKDDNEPSSVKELYDLGVTHINNSQWQSAVQVFEQVLEKTPNNEKAQQYLSLAQLKLDSSAKAAALDRYYNDGIAAARRGDYINAIIAFERVKKQDPNFKDIDLVLRQAQQKFEELNDRSFKRKYYNQGLIAFEQENWQQALDAFDKLYILDPNYQDVQYLIKEVKKNLNKKTETESIDLYYQNGIEFMRKGDWLNALINFEKVKMIDPDYKQVNTYISQTNQNFEKSQQDVSDSQEFVINRTNPLLIIGVVIAVLFIQFGGIILFSPKARARFYLLQKKYDKASEIYEKILNYNPEKVKLYITLANIYINVNRKDEVAVKVYEKVIEANLDENLKSHLIPVVNQYYSKKQLPIRSIDKLLKEDIKNMGN